MSTGAEWRETAERTEIARVVPENLRTAVYGIMAAPVLYCADKYGILADLVDEGSASSHSVAERLGLDPETTQRLLIVLAAFGIVTRHDGDVFGIPAKIAPYVDTRNPSYIGGFTAYMVGGDHARLEHMEQCLVKGKPPLGDRREATYQHVYRDERSTSAFFQAMWDLSFGVSGELAELAQLDGHRCLVDVGGGDGPFAIAALLQFPALSAVVFDLPQARPYFDRRCQLFGLQHRMRFVGGDFFRDPIPHGDVIALGYVLSNWPDDLCILLLRRAYEALGAGGRVLIMDRLFDDGLDGPVDTAVMNLLMHIETNGKHRSASQFRSLLADAGFTRCHVLHSSADKHLVVGQKEVPAGQHAPGEGA